MAGLPLSIEIWHSTKINKIALVIQLWKTSGFGGRGKVFMAQKVDDKATFQQRKLIKEWLHLKLLDTLKVCDLGEEAA